jgi:hypothetical protein
MLFSYRVIHLQNRAEKRNRLDCKKIWLVSIGTRKRSPCLIIIAMGYDYSLPILPTASLIPMIPGWQVSLNATMLANEM